MFEVAASTTVMVAGLVWSVMWPVAWLATLRPRGIVLEVVKDVTIGTCAAAADTSQPNDRGGKRAKQGMFYRESERRRTGRAAGTTMEATDEAVIVVIAVATVAWW